MKAASLSQHGTHGIAVTAQERADKCLHALAATSRSTSATRPSIERGVPITRTSRSRPASRSWCSRNHSRNRRLARFRLTALSRSRLGTISPSRALVAPFAFICTETPMPRFGRTSASKTAMPGESSRSFRVKRLRSLKLRAAPDPWPGARGLPRDHLACACGRGTRECACAAPRKVEMCASYLGFSRLISRIEPGIRLFFGPACQSWKWGSNLDSLIGAKRHGRCFHRAQIP